MQQPQPFAKLCAQTEVWIAIFNPNATFIVGGNLESLEQIAMQAVALGGRSTWLPVRVGSHTPLMAEAATQFGMRLGETACQRPTTLLLSDVTGDRVRDV